MFLGLLMTACSDGPANKTEYVVTHVAQVTEPGFRHNLRAVEDNSPTYLHLPTAQFTEGEHITIKRTRRKLIVRSTNDYLR